MRRKIAVFLAGGIPLRAAGIAVIACLALFCLALIVLTRRSAERAQTTAALPSVLSGSQSGTGRANDALQYRRSGASSAVSQIAPQHSLSRFDPESILASHSFNDESQPAVLSLSSLSVSAKLDRLDIEGGMLKVSWGAADGFGPLDVVNPRDYSNLRGTDFLPEKIAQPMIHGSYAIDQASKIEAVLVYPNARASDGAQAGLRFTSAVGPADFGVQYYYGKLPKPSAFADLPAPREAALLIDNSRYNQLGADVSSTIGSMTVRGEISAHLADDVSDTDKTGRHPSILWAVGTERFLAGGLKLNAQYSGTAGTDTIFALRLSKNMLDDRLSFSGGVYTELTGRDILRSPGQDYVKFTVAYDF